MTNTSTSSDKQETAICNASYHVGQRVHIINSTPGGMFFIEGEATITRAGKTHENRCCVRFDGDGNGHEVPRFVDIHAQKDPVAYVTRLNAMSSRPLDAENKADILRAEVMA